VDFSGYFHPVFKLDFRNGIRVLNHINAHGTGTGQTSRAVYNWNDTINFNLNLGNGATTQTFGQTFLLTGRGSASDLKLKALFHIVANVNGVNITVDFFSETCK